MRKIDLKGFTPKAKEVAREQIDRDWVQRLLVGGYHVRYQIDTHQRLLMTVFLSAWFLLIVNVGMVQAKPGDFMYTPKMMLESIAQEQGINYEMRKVSELVVHHQELAAASNCVQLLLVDQELTKYVQHIHQRLQTDAIGLEDKAQVLQQLSTDLLPLDDEQLGEGCKPRKELSELATVYHLAYYQLTDLELSGAGPFSSALEDAVLHYEQAVEALHTAVITDQQVLDQINELLLQVQITITNLQDFEAQSWRSGSYALALHTVQKSLASAERLIESTSLVDTDNWQDEVATICGVVGSNAESTYAAECSEQNLAGKWNSISLSLKVQTKLSQGKQVFEEYMRYFLDGIVATEDVTV